MIEIDGAKALSLLEQVVEGDEDFTYESPNGAFGIYMHDGEPSCMIGQAFHLAGVSIETLGWMDKEIRGLGVRDPGKFEEKDISLTPEAYQIFSVAQNQQDLRLPWGEALDAAREVADATHSA